MTDPDPDDEFTPPRPPPRTHRLRTFALWMFGTLAVIVVVLFLGRWEMGRLGQRKLDAANAQLDATEPDWRLEAIQAERKKAEPPTAENAAPIILDLAERVPADWKKWQGSPEANEFWVRHTDHHLPPPAAVDVAREHAAQTLTVRTDALKLRDTRGGQFPLTITPDPMTTLLPHLDKCRRVVSLLQYDAYLAAIEKNPNRGIAAARAVLAVARAIGDEPLLISQLVRIACSVIASQTAMQVLAWGTPTEGLAELQAELLAAADLPYFRVGMRGERAMLDQAFRGLEDGTIPAEHWFSYAGIGQPGPQHYAAFRAYRAFIPGDHAKSLEILTAYLDATKLPSHEQLAAMKAIPIPPGPPDEFRYIITRLMVPASQKIAEAGLRCRADLLSAATAIACERFRMKYNRWPHELAELTPEYLAAVPHNPFDGKPIGYCTFPDRVAVYCFWPDAPYKIEDQPQDLRAGNTPGTGIGYRVWNPNQRGLPAEEKKAP